MTDWKRVRDEAAEEYMIHTVVEGGNGEAMLACLDDFKAGYDYAIANDSRVKALIEAFKNFIERADLHKYEGGDQALRRAIEKASEALRAWEYEALKAFEGSGE